MRAATSLLLHTYPCSLPLLILSPRQFHQYPSPQNPHTLSSSHLLRQIQVCRYRRWDSNAESFRNQNFNFNFDSNSGNDGSDDDDDDTPFGLEQLGGVVEEFIDGVWIFKAFRSFGWFLPATVISLLVSTGPKAFLMALALPLGQSALSLAFQKLWGNKQNNPKRKAKSKKKPRARPRRKVELEEDEEEEEEENQGIGKGKMGYQSWVGGNEAPAAKDSQDASSLGGWDVLDSMESVKRSARTERGPRRTPIKKGKLSRGGRKGEMPLFLRLLIAVFPFLGSWTKML
ncbi:unnamed protein product [Ilex paraguariensis]|uniref:Transmembrane protein n=1 Tax=Ilex paraguariensis TaxID=185542 RepID=A0ABC8TI75_9AQUA